MSNAWRIRLRRTLPKHVNQQRVDLLLKAELIAQTDLPSMKLELRLPSASFTATRSNLKIKWSGAVSP